MPLLPCDGTQTIIAVCVTMSPESPLEIQSSHSAYVACSILHKFSFSFPSHFPFPWCPVLHGDGKFSNNKKKHGGPRFCGRVPNII